MAGKKIWVYVLDTDLTDKVYEVDGRAEVVNPILHHMYSADETGTDVGAATSHALYHATNHLVDTADLAKAIGSYTGVGLAEVTHLTEKQRLQAEAQDLGINTTGMTKRQLEDAIKAVNTITNL